MTDNRITTPIYDFVRDYASSGVSRFHMPGHKGSVAADITEIKGADSLYEASGIILESEQTASRIFGTAATFYSAEGSSQCIRAMLSLVTGFCRHDKGQRPVILAARNVHRSFITAAALLDFDIEWIFPEDTAFSLCSCPVSSDHVKLAIASMAVKPCAVYLTSPDYLGNIQDISSIAAVVHEFDIPLLVDNAHGAYLHFLEKPAHPMNLGADMCCDSAHKTLPAVTGCAYLHISKNADPDYISNARKALALFGSTSPSYLLLQSLDLVNKSLAEGWNKALAECIDRITACKKQICQAGWRILGYRSLSETEADSYLRHEPCKIVICASESGISGISLADQLRNHLIECEYADPDYVVLMAAPGNTETDFERLIKAMHEIAHSPVPCITPALPVIHPEKALSVREAMFSDTVCIPADISAGRICCDTAITCPPAIPIVTCGEIIPPAAIALFRHYGIDNISVLNH